MRKPIAPAPNERSDIDDEVFSPWMTRIARYGVSAFVAGGILIGIAFLTNPVPDPSFPWATFPPSLRMAYTQPRIEHWPVTYTIGLWFVVFSAPLVLIRTAHRLCASTRLSERRLFLTAPAILMLALTTYCRFLWPKPHPATWNAPSYTFVCWTYCSTYDPFWSNLAYGVALVGVGITIFADRQAAWIRYGRIVWGVLALPLGLPVVLAEYKHQNSSG